MSKVIFQIEGGSAVTIECNQGDNLLEAARRANVAIDAPCSGNGSCGKCRVKLTEGTLDSLQSRHISQEEWDEGWRLSCCSKVNGDCTVLVPDIASAYQSRMKTADLSSPKEIAIFKSTEANLRASGIQFTNNFRSAVIAMAEPSPEDTMPDIERLTWAVEEALGVEKVEVPFCVMVKLAATLREFGWTVCVKGELAGDTFRCMEVCDPEDTRIVGCAIDIGTTTVAMVLTDLVSGELLAKGSSGNGQIRYGADVINRIIEQSKPGGRKRLQDAIVKETLTPIIANLCKTAHISARSILRLSVGANTTMNHLLVGVDANPVRMDPYIPNASVKHMRESLHFHGDGNGGFLLVEALPQSPQDTIPYPGNAAKMQRLRDFSNLLWTLNVHLFRVLSPQEVRPLPESDPHLPWQFAENASRLWPFGNPHI